MARRVTTDTLYECTGCGTLVRVTTGGCPSCGKTEGKTVERGSLTGDGPREVELPWYREVRLEASG